MLRFHIKEPSLAERIKFLEDKVKILEDENVGNTNALYEIENRLQAQIDALISYTMLNNTEVTNDVY
jgi:uncharacterized protein YutE (UPF0331/DUF86 family)